MNLLSLILLFQFQALEHLVNDGLHNTRSGKNGFLVRKHRWLRLHGSYSNCSFVVQFVIFPPAIHHKHLRGKIINLPKFTQISIFLVINLFHDVTTTQLRACGTHTSYKAHSTTETGQPHCHSVRYGQTPGKSKS